MIYLVEDNEALRNGLMAMLKEFAQLEVSGASGTASSRMAAAAA